MWHMAWGWEGRLQRAVAAAALTLVGALAFSVPALGADPPPVPKPDPPPKANPPPPAEPAPQPPAPVEPAPVAPAPAAPPAVVHPTAAERRAAALQEAAAKRQAQRKAANAARARAARAKAAAAKKLAAAQRRDRARAKDVLAAGDGSPSSNSGLPFLVAAFSMALVLFGLALTPAWAVPWRRGARVLEARREELGVMGATGVVATVVFFLLVEVTK
jgi:hypothetical protein